MMNDLDKLKKKSFMRRGHACLRAVYEFYLSPNKP
jgi:hypothetical protein